MGPTCQDATSAGRPLPFSPFLLLSLSHTHTQPSLWTGQAGRPAGGEEGVGSRRHGGSARGGDDDDTGEGGDVAACASSGSERPGRQEKEEGQREKAAGKGGENQTSFISSPTTTSSTKNVVPLSPSSLPFGGCDGVRGVNDGHR